MKLTLAVVFLGKGRPWLQAREVAAVP